MDRIEFALLPFDSGLSGRNESLSMLCKQDFRLYVQSRWRVQLALVDISTAQVYLYGRTAQRATCVLLGDGVSRCLRVLYLPPPRRHFSFFSKKYSLLLLIHASFVSNFLLASGAEEKIGFAGIVASQLRCLTCKSGKSRRTIGERPFPLWEHLPANPSTTATSCRDQLMIFASSSASK